SIPLKTFITTPKTPKGSIRCTAENGMDFQKPSTRSETANAVPNINEKPKKCTVCHGTNQMTWLISDSMAGLNPGFPASSSAPREHRTARISIAPPPGHGSRLPTQG